MRVLSVGEVLWDVFEDGEFLGGAPLNFSASARRLGNTVSLLTAVGADARGSLTIAAMQKLGLTTDTDIVQTVPGRCTGSSIVTIDSAGNPTFVIERPAAFDFVDLNAKCLTKICRSRPEWIYFGTLAHTMEQGEQRLKHLLASNPTARCFYDINLREGHWNLDLVERLARLATIIKLNEAEAELLFALTRGTEPFSMETFCEFWSSAYGGETICITQGGNGCAVWRNGKIQSFPGFPVTVVDTVGAGDAFAAAFLHGNQSGWPIQRTACFANALGAIVASRAGATPNWTIEEYRQLMVLNNVPVGEQL